MVGRLVARLVDVDTLTAADVDRMWAVFERYYADVERSRFESDLYRKARVVLLLDGERIVGFSTMVIERGEVQGQRYAALYSGDTVLERAYWGQTALHRLFVWTLFRMWLSNPGVRCYWFLISKGYQTYLLMTRNWVRCWPVHGAEMPAYERAVLDELAPRMFGDAYQPDRGLLVFDQPMGRLKEGVAAAAELPDDPDVRYFVARNPNYAAGEELCCLGRVELAMFAKFVGRHLMPWRRGQNKPRTGPV
jgi:hypothetical protein